VAIQPQHSPQGEIGERKQHPSILLSAATEKQCQAASRDRGATSGGRRSVAQPSPDLVFARAHETGIEGATSEVHSPNRVLKPLTIQVVNGAARPPRAAAGALRELAVLARRDDGSRRLGRWSSPRSRARDRRRFKDYGHYEESYASSSGPAASRTARTSGGTSDWTRGSRRSRSASATRPPSLRTCRADGVLPGAGAHCCEGSSEGEGILSYHRIVTTENKWLAARYGLEARVWISRRASQPRPGRRALDPADAEGARAARA
jgi:hypothetical protein